MPVPNIVLITIDDCGLDQINSYGVPGGLNTTPNLDYWATQGIRYQWHYGQTNCAPGRSSVLLGRNPDRTGIGTVGQPPNQVTGRTYAACGAQWEPANTEVFLASRLKAAGYTTGHFGKWHLHHPSSSTDYDEVRTKAGYDHYAGWPYNLGPTSNGVNNTETAQSFGYNAAVTGASGWPRIVNNSISNGGSPAPGSLTNAGGSPTDYCSLYITTKTISDAINWAGTAVQPFFMSVSLHAVHSPLQAPTAALYTAASAHGAVAGFTQLYYPNGHPSYGGGTTAVPVFEYYATVDAATGSPYAPVKPWTRRIMRATDYEINRLLDLLPNNTLIFITSDNGSSNWTSQNDTTSVEGSWDPAKVKNTMYDGALRLPLIVTQTAGTGIISSPGSVNTDLIATTDIYATIVQAAGGTMPAVTNDSTSFYGTFSGGSHSRTEVISQAFDPNVNPANFSSTTFTQRWYSIRGKSGYKVIRQITNSPKVEFYKIADSTGAVVDQYEATNLLASPLSRLDNHYFQQLNKQLDSYITNVSGLPTG